MAYHRLSPLLGLAIVLLALPLLLSGSYQYNIAVLAGFNAIVCVGLNLLVGYAGQISLGHAGFLGLGAYASAILVSKYDWPAPLAVAAAAAAVGLIAYAVGRPILRLKGHFLAMATLGVGVIISIVLKTEIDLTGGPDGMTVAPFQVLGLDVVGDRLWYWVVAALLLAEVWLTLNLVDSPAGRALRAVHGSELAAGTLGVDTAAYKLRVFVLSAVMASVAGSLWAHFLGFVTPGASDFSHSVEFVTMVVFGGMASTLGAVVGAAVLTVLPQLLTVFQDYEHILLGAVLMLTMVFMPRGVVPTLAEHLPPRWRR
jgi:branched-chain amino acid transport system permease protein